MYLLPLGVSSNGPIKSIPTYILRRVHAISKKFCVGKLVAKRISTMLWIRVTFLTVYGALGHIRAFRALQTLSSYMGRCEVDRGGGRNKITILYNLMQLFINRRRLFCAFYHPNKYPPCKRLWANYMQATIPYYMPVLSSLHVTMHNKSSVTSTCSWHTILHTSGSTLMGWRGAVAFTKFATVICSLANVTRRNIVSHFPCQFRPAEARRNLVVCLVSSEMATCNGHL